MLVDQLHQHQTTTNQSISVWARLEFIVVSAVVFSKTYCVGVSLGRLFHVLTILSLPAGDSLHPRPQAQARGHARKAVHWAKDPRIRYELPEETKCHWQKALSVRVRVCECARAWVCTGSAQSGRMTLCTMIHWHQPRDSPGLDRLRIHHMLFGALRQSRKEHRAKVTSYSMPCCLVFILHTVPCYTRLHIKALSTFHAFTLIRMYRWLNTNSFIY